MGTAAVREQKVGGANLDWGSLFFSHQDVHCHVQYKWRGGTWDKGAEIKEPYMNMHVMANVFHYGQAIFEGQKVFHCKDGKVRIFRDAANFGRMTRGAERLGMPSMPQEMFHEAIDRAIRANLDFVPPYGSNGALYVRPFMVGSGKQLGLGPSDEFLFTVVVAPVGSYYKTAGLTPIPCKVIDDFDRAAPQGVGQVKCAGNYAADIVPSKKAKEEGFPIGLYLDAKEHRYIEEFNTSNFVAISKDGKTYITPDSQSVLESVTNKCLEDLARDHGLQVERRRIDFDAEVANFGEVGAVGTAVVITAIKSITRGTTVHEFKAPDVLQKLHDAVRAIQVGEAPDTHGWLRELSAA
uniref:Branched-chain-amino-acid transaminase n=1 Tax=Zooxanthella nutricula TaxID=1333877 RepID=A0A6V0I6T2_9DINO